MGHLLYMILLRRSASISLPSGFRRSKLGSMHNCRGSSLERAHFQLCEATIKSKAGCTYLLSGTRGSDADGITGA
ncbi:hypothetical protein P692DRAFT_20567858 [Suillus brevipes Sb2]|nr:hypothetical protein P692DRAFT_20567858 [Suillus brevipes Sb2]